MTQLLNITIVTTIAQKGNQLSVEIKINETTLAK